MATPISSYLSGCGIILPPLPGFHVSTLDSILSFDFIVYFQNHPDDKAALMTHLRWSHFEFWPCQYTIIELSTPIKMTSLKSSNGTHLSHPMKVKMSITEAIQLKWFF